MIKKIFFLFLVFLSLSYGTEKEIIKNKIDEVLSQLPSTTNCAILIINPLNRDTIFSLHDTLSVIPASNTKLFTTATAISLLGGNYPLSTKILTSDKNFKDGVINGNLYIKGYGNSTFTSDDLENMVKELKRMGIKKVTGNIVGDDSYFDELYTRADWIVDGKKYSPLPPVSALVINRNRVLIRRKIRYRRRGRLRTRIIYVNNKINNPPLYAAKLLRDKLIAAGIKVNKRAVKGITPKNTIVLSESTILLKDLIKLINKHSDNFLAECLFKTLGAAVTGKQGNSFYSTQTILKFLKDNGIFSRGTSIVDGSGLSRYDQVTVGAIVGLLEKMYFDLKNFNYFYNSLSIAGKDGTLRDRMRGTTAENDFHGKTGTLHGVSSLSGYLKTADGDELIVSMIFDFHSGSLRLHREVENKIIEILTNSE